MNECERRRREGLHIRRMLVVAAVLAGACAAPDEAPIRIGAVYPTGGGQGAGGLAEYRGLELAARMANARGGVRGRPVEILLEHADSPDAAPRAIDALARRGVRIVAGTHGSTIARPAAAAASRKGMVFWETGAVGELGMQVAQATAPATHVFRFAPTGESLGAAAVAFVRDELAPKLQRTGLRYAVAYVDDEYGRSVGQGALGEIERSAQTLVEKLPYTLRDADYDAIAATVAAARTDILVVSAYLDDGVALRRALVRARVPLVASIGTSSSYCMPEFGDKLGADAVGLFASDKPDGDVLDASRLSPGAANVLREGRAAYQRRYGTAMNAPAVTGFAAGWALFRYVLPAARSEDPGAVASAARATKLGPGALPNGSGLAFEGTTNVRATSVIWEWVRERTRAVVWPPAFATDPIAVLPIGGAA
jgi:branched-chain amino acid transport system substrate-binding protein